LFKICCHYDSALQEGAEKFREIREAYETLSDETKRRRYDEELARQGSEVRITRVPEIIESRRSLLDEIDRFFSRTDEYFEGFNRRENFP
jgi:curved DNA-binding protein CbpA